ncbi:MAG: anti-sigma regulatory factor [Deltaproteobacteria bacterium]|nr:anti-sigma regulatory factor [Deltaproteobacteria bacterium]
MVKKFEVTGGDFSNAGRVSTDIKTLLKSRKIDQEIIRRLAIATFEAEMNIIMYARKGTIALHVCRDKVMLKIKDEGQGIPNLELAMIEGFSTASDEMRELGFGAGMGLPNIKRNADEFRIASEIGVGTNLDIRIYL